VFATPRAYVRFGTVLAEGIALWGTTPFIADLQLRAGTGATREAGFVIGGIGIGGIAYTLFMPVLLRSMNRTAIMGIGGVLGTAGLVALALELDSLIAAAMFCVSGFGYMMLHNSIQNESVELAPTARSSAYSMHAFFFFTGQTLGPVLFGLLLGHWGPVTALCVGALIFVLAGLIGGLMFARLDRR
ncbi:MAG: hypothetical protein AB7O43_04280, partial [Hyphomicrobiaceae bacterium]